MQNLDQWLAGERDEILLFWILPSGYYCHWVFLFLGLKPIILDTFRSFLHNACYRRETGPYS
jgi:hypothetical protein